MNIRATALIASLLLVLSGVGQAQTSFTLVRAQIEVAEPDRGHEKRIEGAFGDGFAEIGDADAYAKGRASLGNAGAYAVSTSDAAEAFGETWWADGFTVSGGSGTGTLTIAVSVSGSLSGLGNAMYGLYAQATPFSAVALGKWLDFGHPAAPAGSTALIPMTEGFPVSGTTVLMAELPFTYGETVYIASYFGAETWGTGEASFYGSAHFGITAPAGALLGTASGTTYLSAAAVPEPSAAWLLLLGLVAVATRQLRFQRLGTAQ